MSNFCLRGKTTKMNFVENITGDRTRSKKDINTIWQNLSREQNI